MRTEESNEFHYSGQGITHILLQVIENGEIKLVFLEIKNAECNVNEHNERRKEQQPNDQQLQRQKRQLCKEFLYLPSHDLRIIPLSYHISFQVVIVGFCDAHIGKLTNFHI